MPYKIEFNIALDCITKDELLERIDNGTGFVIIDTVGKYGGNRFRIKGARTIPYPEVIDRRNEFRSHKEIIVYCRHKDCKASKKVATGLRVLNVDNVKVYEGGIDEWTACGLPVEDE